jgi:hypothetical protein
LPSATSSQAAVDATFPKFDGTAQRKAPTAADLVFIKNVVKVLRKAECTVVSHTKALNEVAGFWGQRSWGALDYMSVGSVETIVQRRAKLAPLAALVLQRLGLDFRDGELSDLVSLAVGIPVLEYVFERYPYGAKPVLRLYSNGVAHVALDGIFPAIYGGDLAKLGLQAIEYHIGGLKDVDTVDELQELHRLALWMSEPYVAQRQLREATRQELQEALENGLPISHYALLVHAANGSVYSGDNRVLMGLPAFYDGSTGLQTAVADGETLFGEDLYEMVLKSQLALEPSTEQVDENGWSRAQPTCGGRWLWREDPGRQEVELTLTADGREVAECGEAEKGTPQYYWEQTATTQQRMPGWWKRIG